MFFLNITSFKLFKCKYCFKFLERQIDIEITKIMIKMKIEVERNIPRSQNMNEIDEMIDTIEKIMMKDIMKIKADILDIMIVEKKGKEIIMRNINQDIAERGVEKEADQEIDREKM